ncbi:hypothetical protein FACS189443_2050 [Planctomycetales bacterium]|nr:hypothetical protein FACS189443_2050 [Planctomycetales bacterium]
MRIVIDVNSWVSYLMSSKYRKRIKNVLLSNTLLVSPQFLEELEDVCMRPQFIKYFSFNEYSELQQYLQDEAELIVTVSEIAVCRDPNDDYLLELALDGKADYLITGDNDLLTLKLFERTKIVSITGFETQD